MSLVITVAACVAAAFLLMLGALLWGARHGTLRETSQEAIDRQFAELVRRIAYPQR